MVPQAARYGIFAHAAMHRTRQLTLAISLITVIGCGKGSPTGTTANVPDFYPIRVGSWWVYYYSAFSGTVKDSVADTTTLPGEIRAYVIRHRSYFGNPPYEDTSTSYIVRTTEEVRRYFALPDLYSFIILRLPLKVGVSWVQRPTIDSTVYDSMTVAGRGTVTAPAGTFAHCFRIVEKYEDSMDPYHPGPFTREFWYAPNVGFVRGRLFDSDTIELIEYHIN